ncbi:hypothetical protein CIHG_07980 [Coccidioides immitis H538.4]|nr:hypothetical protein CIHG_07980 [Coccidioides immitis H538.4]
MASSVQVYYVPNNTIGPMFSSMRAERSIYAGSGWFIAATEKPEIPEAQDLSLTFSCNDQSFVDAAAVAERISPGQYIAYRKIIKQRKLDEQFKGSCEIHDVVITDYLKLVEEKWQKFARESGKADLKSRESLCRLELMLYDISDCAEDEIRRHPKLWQSVLKSVLNPHLPAIAECIGRLSLYVWHNYRPIKHNTLYGWAPSELLWRFVKDRCQWELADLQKEIAQLKAPINSRSVAERPSLYQFLLHLGLILFSYDFHTLCKLRGKEADIASWSHHDWEERCDRFDQLSDKDYDALVDFLREFAPFANIDLTSEDLRNQIRALIAGLRRVAGGVASKTGTTLKMSKKFSIAANIMILCAYFGIFAIVPTLEHDISLETYIEKYFEYHIAAPRRSPLYGWKAANEMTVTSKLDQVFLFLQPEAFPTGVTEVDLAASSCAPPPNLSPVRATLKKTQRSRYWRLRRREAA